MWAKVRCLHAWNAESTCSNTKEKQSSVQLLSGLDWLRWVHAWGPTSFQHDSAAIQSPIFGKMRRDAAGHWTTSELNRGRQNYYNNGKEIWSKEETTHQVGPIHMWHERSPRSAPASSKNACPNRDRYIFFLGFLSWLRVISWGFCAAVADAELRGNQKRKEKIWEKFSLLFSLYFWFVIKKTVLFN